MIFLQKKISIVRHLVYQIPRKLGNLQLISVSSFRNIKKVFFLMVERSHLSYQLYQRKRKSINNWRKFHKIFFGIKFTHYAYGQYVQKKKITGIYFNSNYRAEMKVVLIITDYCLLQFDSLKFFLRVCLHGETQI